RRCAGAMERARRDGRRRPPLARLVCLSHGRSLVPRRLPHAARVRPAFPRGRAGRRRRRIARAVRRRRLHHGPRGPHRDLRDSLPMTIRCRFLPVLVSVLALSAGGCGYFSSPEQRVAKAEALIAKGEQRSALIELRNALQKKPDLPGARLALAEVVLWLGDPAGAERELKRVPATFEPARHDDLALRIDLAAGRPANVVERVGTPAAG